MRPALIVHGGAGSPPTEEHAERQAAVDRSLEAGWVRIGEGALEAVVATVRALEDEPALNAGIGACFNRDGFIELDAGVMEGTGLRAGAVGAVRDVRHPVELARALLEDGRHVLLVADGASAYARDHGVEMADPTLFETPRQRRNLERLLVEADTVGAVARDVEGHLAVAVSTGGVTGKLPGRLGDSPVPGAGFYAQDGAGAICGTGLGEAFLRLVLSHLAVVELMHGMAPDEVARGAIEHLEAKTGASGGVIVVGAEGEPAFAFNTPFMPVAMRVG
ncbi:MAG TPA: isoaspartyl peptidase/L-asparaginase family protein [Candidatus Dormibacteraeota bacterium]